MHISIKLVDKVKNHKLTLKEWTALFKDYILDAITIDSGRKVELLATIILLSILTIVTPIDTVMFSGLVAAIRELLKEGKIDKAVLKCVIKIFIKKG